MTRPIAIAMLVFVILMAAGIGGFSASRFQLAAAPSAQPPELYAGVPLDAHLLALDKQALAAAYHDQLKLLFSVWMKDGGHADATRITNGLRNARRAYGQAAQQIARRERELEQQGR